MKKRVMCVLLSVIAMLTLAIWMKDLTVSADVDMVWEGPVIESFEIVNVEDGGNIYSDGYVEARVKMYPQGDATINFDAMKIDYAMIDEGYGSDWKCSRYVSEGDDVYTLYFDNVHNTPCYNMQLYKFCVADSYGNESGYEIKWSNNDDDYIINILNAVNQDIVINSLTVTPDNPTLTDDVLYTEIVIEVDAEGTSKDASSHFRVEYEKGYDIIHVDAYYDADSDTYKGYFGLAYGSAVGTYELENFIYVNNGVREGLNYNSESSKIATEIVFSKNNTDKTAPVFEELYMTINGVKNTEYGTKVEYDDEVVFWAKIKDEHMQKPSDKMGMDAYVDLILRVWLENIENEEYYVHLKYDDSTGYYKGVVDFFCDEEGKKMYPTGWRVLNYSANDYYGNRAFFDDYSTPVMSFDTYFYLMKDGVCKLDDSVIKDKTSDITDASKGEDVTIHMQKTDGYVATEMPIEFLMAAKGRDVNVILDMGTYSWTINGKDITAQNPEDIDLEVLFDYNFIDEDIVEAFTDEEARQLYLAYSGQFGFTAKLKMNYGTEHKGKYGNLYYFNPQTEKMEFECSAVINNEGYLCLDFSHASDYIIVLSDADDNIDTEKETTSKKENQTTVRNDNESSITNGDETTVMEDGTSQDETLIGEDETTIAEDENDKESTGDSSLNAEELSGNDTTETKQGKDSSLDKDSSKINDIIIYVVIGIIIVLVIVGGVGIYLYKAGKLKKFFEK